MARRLAMAGAAGAAAIALVGAWEGYRLYTYRDIVGVPTYCYGETRGAKFGKRYTLPECKNILKARLEEFHYHVNRCVKVPMTDNQRVAFVSLAYNIGAGAFCKSSVVRYANQGKMDLACNAIKLYNRAGGRVIKGLVNRREAEYRYCMRK